MQIIQAILHSHIAAMVKEGKINAEKEISIQELTQRINEDLDATCSVADVFRSARDAGYMVYRPADGPAIFLEKKIEEIEALKMNWAHDPNWDIEETDGFEAYAEELRAWRNELEARIDINRKEKKEKRTALVREQTGVRDVNIAADLCTWSEIESDIERATSSDYSLIDLAAAQARATLLQAAQIKRVADALETLALASVGM